jgi:hypothetical protein
MLGIEIYHLLLLLKEVPKDDDDDVQGQPVGVGIVSFKPTKIDKKPEIHEI